MPHFWHEAGEGEDITLTNVCQVHQWHAHHYDHQTTVLTGVGELSLQGEAPRVLKAGETLTVPAHTVHQVKALEVPFRFQCVFQHRDFDGKVSPVYVGNVEACT